MAGVKLLTSEMLGGFWEEPRQEVEIGAEVVMGERLAEESRLGGHEPEGH